MKLLRIMLIALMFFSISALSLSCASGQDSAATENEVATVQRGDLTIDITAVGNLALSQKEKLTFEIPGTVAEVLVKEGDSIIEGQVLAKLDTSDWEDNIEVLQDRLTAAKRALTSKERALVAVERQVTAKELAVRQAQLDLQTAESTVSQIADVKKVLDIIDNAEYALKFAKSMLSGEFGGGLVLKDYTYWYQLKALAEAELAEAQTDLQEILDGSSIMVSSDVLLEVAKKQLTVEQKQKALEDAQFNLDDAKQAVKDAQLDLDDAKQDVEDIQSDIDEVLNTNLDIIAPFDGFVTRVNVEGGDEVMKGTVAVELADPNKFEADVLVSEMDIFQVKLGGEATVQVDAMQMIVLPAEVTRIAPTATIQAGVVNYQVKVEVQSLEAMVQERQEAREGGMQDLMQDVMQDIASGEMPEMLKRAVEAGRITQEQAEEIMERMKSGEMPFPPGGGEGQMPFPPGIGEGEMPFPTESGQIPTMLSGDFQLREGLTVTVSILIAESNDVLLVPNGAINTQGRQTYVKVISPDGTIEERTITTGISDWQYTEVTDGLNEGEQIVVPQGTTTTTQQNQPGGFMIPGMGRPR